MVYDAVGTGFRDPISGKCERRHRVYESGIRPNICAAVYVAFFLTAPCTAWILYGWKLSSCVKLVVNVCLVYLVTLLDNADKVVGSFPRTSHHHDVDRCMRMHFIA